MTTIDLSKLGTGDKIKYRNGVIDTVLHIGIADKLYINYPVSIKTEKYPHTNDYTLKGEYNLNVKESKLDIVEIISEEGELYA